MKLSVVIPVHNEEENIDPAAAEVAGILCAAGLGDHELLFVDDGSLDESWKRIEALASRDPRVRGISLRRNYGQTAALDAGAQHAEGEVVAFLDADLQSDPASIPAMIAKLAEGHDFVVGWRRRRHDPLSKTLPSWIANRLIRRVLGLPFHDIGCTLQVFRAELARELRLYGEMHRFIPALAAQLGARVTEMEIRHRPRERGVSKYGMGRTFKVLLDLVTVRFLLRHSTKPMYFFGGAGLALFALSLGCFGTAGFLALVAASPGGCGPLLVLGAVLAGVGVNCVLLGLLAEVQLRSHFESRQQAPYAVRARTEARTPAPPPWTAPAEVFRMPAANLPDA